MGSNIKLGMTGGKITALLDPRISRHLLHKLSADRRLRFAGLDQVRGLTLTSTRMRLDVCVKLIPNPNLSYSLHPTVSHANVGLDIAIGIKGETAAKR